ncbi:peptide deformylase [Ponticaulis sp.]|jgi:peptide deformylase|uniref:peptide deformylase n=1 Tax=Ponticaulis sp. TaxID=2020902 RepID=UPI000C6AF94B|nr:peptide deformylase [Ponticaulis sp.]MBN03786.1 peptide deformylase [Ponticaulis sp.]MDF1679002.1 peptide deformylase [Ponticaulis sp.]|tara:strand:+ start:222 stop:746 length:525 start_codon:yes stop_codon:yes gene_type:complete
MAIREILTIPNPILKQVSTPVEGGVTDEIRALMDDMLETMYAAPGIGLAAVQIGVPKRIIVMDLGGPNDEKQPKYFVNPEIVETIEETQPYEEGCLSVPDYYDEVERPARCLIRYLDYDGNQVEEWAEDLYAVCIQHEMDHLEGTLFIDHLSRLRRQRAVEKVKKAKRQKERVA